MSTCVVPCSHLKLVDINGRYQCENFACSNHRFEDSLSGWQNGAPVNISTAYIPRKNHLSVVGDADDSLARRYDIMKQSNILPLPVKLTLCKNIWSELSTVCEKRHIPAPPCGSHVGCYFVLTFCSTKIAPIDTQHNTKTTRTANIAINSVRNLSEASQSGLFPNHPIIPPGSKSAPNRANHLRSRQHDAEHFYFLNLPVLFF